jgi:membrane-associated phospholipid phosphatase
VPVAAIRWWSAKHPRRSSDAGGSVRKISLRQRLKTHWFLKAIGTTGVITAVLVFYLYLLKNPIFPVTEMPLTALDRMIGFQPAALVFYVSLWVYVGLPPALIETRRQLINYAWAVSALCMVGLGIFLIWPTAVPSTDIDWGRYPGFGFLKEIDGAGNAFPSLHVATAVYSAIWLERLLRDMGRGAVIRALSWLWCVGIVYSALATKQHVAVDALAGAMLGIAGAALSLQPGVGIVSRAPDNQPSLSR